MQNAVKDAYDQLSRKEEETNMIWHKNNCINHLIGKIPRSVSENHRDSNHALLLQSRTTLIHSLAERSHSLGIMAGSD